MNSEAKTIKVDLEIIGNDYTQLGICSYLLPICILPYVCVLSLGSVHSTKSIAYYIAINLIHVMQLNYIS
ncbi:hypothetical protein F4811DRAFT_499741 [Daldinia bambusicola]|nr:hypothetical protein F4811DRAFT_499741 [Daldinia bambusicola]